MTGFFTITRNAHIGADACTCTHVTCITRIPVTPVTPVTRTHGGQQSEPAKGKRAVTAGRSKPVTSTKINPSPMRGVCTKVPKNDGLLITAARSCRLSESDPHLDSA